MAIIQRKTQNGFKVGGLDALGVVCFDVCLPEKEEKLSESINEDRLKLSKIMRKYTLVKKR